MPSAAGFKVRQFLDLAGVQYVKEQADLRVWCCNKAHPDRIRQDTDLNGRMVDSSKSYLEVCVRQAFGYGYAVNPQERRGPIVEKHEHHSHPSQVVIGPLNPKAKHFYGELLTGTEYRIAVFKQRLVCTSTVRDLDGNGLPLAKRVTASSRYHFNASHIMSRTEREKLLQLASILGLDYGEFDVIRHEDGRLCPIDVNPSPSPPSPHSFTPQDFARIIPEEAELFARTFL